MSSPVILDALRTPIARARKGSLVDQDAFSLARTLVGGVLERTRVAHADIDDLVLAESLQGGGVIARHTAVSLGLTDVPGLAINRHCAAGLGAVAHGAASIAAGMDRVVLTGGVESMSTMPLTHGDELLVDKRCGFIHKLPTLNGCLYSCPVAIVIIIVNGQFSLVAWCSSDTSMKVAMPTMAQLLKGVSHCAISKMGFCHKVFACRPKQLNRLELWTIRRSPKHVMAMVS